MWVNEIIAGSISDHPVLHLTNSLVKRRFKRAENPKTVIELPVLRGQLCGHFNYVMTGCREKRARLLLE